MNSERFVKISIWLCLDIFHFFAQLKIFWFSKVHWENERTVKKKIILLIKIDHNKRADREAKYTFCFEQFEI